MSDEFRRTCSTRVLLLAMSSLAFAAAACGGCGPHCPDSPCAADQRCAISGYGSYSFKATCCNPPGAAQGCCQQPSSVEACTCLPSVDEAYTLATECQSDAECCSGFCDQKDAPFGLRSACRARSDAGSGGGDDGGTSLQGALAFPVRAAWSFYGIGADGGVDRSKAQLSVLSAPMTCAEVQAPLAVSTLMLNLTLRATDGGALTGSLPVPDNASALLASAVVDGGQSNTTTYAVAVSGAATVTMASSSVVSGSFDFSMSLSDAGTGTFSGSFAAPFCGTLPL